MANVAQETIAATINERGNGFPDVGAYVPGDDGELYQVVELDHSIETGSPNWIRARVTLADWDACPEADVHSAQAIIGSEVA